MCMCGVHLASISDDTHVWVAALHLAPPHTVSSMGTLRELAKTKVQYVPTLKMVLSYLEVSSKQEYVVQRIKGVHLIEFWLLVLYSGCHVVTCCTELAKGSCISAYRWNSGGTWKGRDWDQDLPSDAQVHM